MHSCECLQNPTNCWRGRDGRTTPGYYHASYCRTSSVISFGNNPLLYQPLCIRSTEREQRQGLIQRRRAASSPDPQVTTARIGRHSVIPKSCCKVCGYVHGHWKRWHRSLCVWYSPLLCSSLRHGGRRRPFCSSPPERSVWMWGLDGSSRSCKAKRCRAQVRFSSNPELLAGSAPRATSLLILRWPSPVTLESFSRITGSLEHILEEVGSWNHAQRE